MKGKYKITIKNKRLVYNMEIERNITIIKGNSGTGKTTLVNALQNFERLGSKSGVSIKCKRPCHVLSGDDWEYQLSKWSNCIVFIDEGSGWIKSSDFAHAIQNSDNYYVIITRENLYQLPYSIKSILELKKTTSRFNHTYNKTYPYYEHIPNVRDQFINMDLILTEDSNSGHELFSQIAEDNNMTCVSADGNSNILEKLYKLDDKRAMVIADGAALGAAMEKIYRYYKLHDDKVVLYLPESFEWLIMKSEVISDTEIVNILNNPAEYIESKEFFSWERYFTYLLEQKTANTPYKYSKNKLAQFYKQDINIKKILSEISGE